MVDRRYPVLSTVRQCALLSISRSSVYYRPRGTSSKNLAMAMMKLIDQKYLTTPFYGSRRINVWLGREGHSANRKRVRRLADLGTTGHLPAAPDQQASAGPQGVSVSAGRQGEHPAQPGVGGRHHLHPHGQGLPLPGPSGEGWTGTLGTWWPGAYPTPWSLISASRP